jgi:hypothetical protein
MAVPRLAVLVTAIPALVAGCGGGDKPAAPTAEDQVRAAATRLVTTYDSTVVCDRLVTQRLVDEVFAGDREACRSSNIADPPNPEDGKTKVVDVAVTGPRAAVELRQEGGRVAGAGGHFAFVREAGAWKLDRFEDDYLRSVMVESIDAAGAADTGALTDPPLRRCMRANTETLPMASVRAFIYATMNRDRQKAAKLGNAQVEQCPDELAEYVATTIVDAVAEDRGPAFRRCAKRALRPWLEVLDLSRLVLKGNTSDAGTAALQGLALDVHKRCSK